jgi:hypothetical protein
VVAAAAAAAIPRPALNMVRREAWFLDSSIDVLLINDCDIHYRDK